jgi:energy-coupling factor transport system substrate-specific component
LDGVQAVTQSRPILPTPSPRDWLSRLLLVFGLLFGLAMLLYPFLQPVLANDQPPDLARSAEMPLMISVLVGLCLLVLILETQSRTANTRLIALLGVLVAINAALRFLEVGIPGPGGFTPIFVLIILTGYVFGASFGFLMGALTMLVSALITGGVGPWLPGQMLAAGWVGLSAPLLRRVVLQLKWAGKPQEIYLLAAFSILWGFAYGAIMNLWTWPFIIGPTGQSWAPGIGLAEVLRHYLAYYLITSFVWDLMAAAGNALLFLVFGRPILRAMQRFQRRFSFRYANAESASVPKGAAG